MFRKTKKRRKRKIPQLSLSRNNKMIPHATKLPLLKVKITRRKIPLVISLMSLKQKKRKQKLKLLLKLLMPPRQIKTNPKRRKRRKKRRKKRVKAMKAPPRLKMTLQKRNRLLMSPKSRKIRPKPRL